MINKYYLKYLVSVFATVGKVVTTLQQVAIIYCPTLYIACNGQLILKKWGNYRAMYHCRHHIRSFNNRLSSNNEGSLENKKYTCLSPTEVTSSRSANPPSEREWTELARYLLCYVQTPSSVFAEGWSPWRAVGAPVGRWVALLRLRAAVLRHNR